MTHPDTSVPTMHELKPCLFCGGEAFATYKTRDHDSLRHHWVICKHCNARTGNRNYSEADAIAAWNMRAPVADEREPLPCPFCGGRAFATYKTDEDDIRWHSVHCRTECRGYGKHGSEKDAIAAWNTRTTPLRKYPNDEEIIDLAVEPLGIDCDRMPHGVVVFARNLLSRYAAPQASEAVRIQFPAQPLGVFAAGKWTWSGTGQAFSHTDLDEAAFVVYRDALCAQPRAQEELATPSWLDGGADAVAMAREDGLLPAPTAQQTHEQGDAKP